MTNSADPDQLASEEANRSGSTLFAKGMSCSARGGLSFEFRFPMSSILYLIAVL